MNRSHVLITVLCAFLAGACGRTHLLSDYLGGGRQNPQPNPSDPNPSPYPNPSDPNPWDPNPSPNPPPSPNPLPFPVPECVSADLGSELGYELASGTTHAHPHRFTGSCGGNGSNDVAYAWTAPYEGVFRFDTFGSTFDTLLYIWDANEACAPAELAGACNDDAGEDLQSAVTLELYAGQVVFVIVDGFEGAAGWYTLNINATDYQQEYDCWDGIDNDYDGLFDCDDDDCRRAGYCDGSYPQPFPPTPPTPFPPTPYPPTPPTPFPPTPYPPTPYPPPDSGRCPDQDLGSVLGRSVASGNTYWSDNAVSGSCGGWDSPELGYRWTAPFGGFFTFDTFGASFDTILYLRWDTPFCNGAELAGGCNDDWIGLSSSVTVYLQAGQAVVAYVDGYDGWETGDFFLSITASDQAPEVCWDGFDNDMDGLVDCDDGDCWGSPECFGLPPTPYPPMPYPPMPYPPTPYPPMPYPPTPYPPTPYPPVPNPPVACQPIDLGSRIGQWAADGYNDGISLLSGSCGGYGAPETVFRWTAPREGVFTFDTRGSEIDTLLYLLQDAPQCGGQELWGACNDDWYELDSRVSISLQAGQTINVVVDGFSDYDRGYFVLNISQPTTSQGEICTDGIDNDRDGRIDCADDECYSHLSCYYPPPPFPPMPPVPPVPPPDECNPIELGSSLGNPVAEGYNQGPSRFAGSCGGHGAPETVYRWTAPYSGVFIFQTLGSATDTLLYVKEDAPLCDGGELYDACNDDWQGLDSRVSVYLSRGQSINIFVDGFGSSSGYFVLNISSQSSPLAEICWDGIDNDRDGWIDCADDECFRSDWCYDRLPPEPPVQPYCGAEYLGESLGRGVARGSTSYGNWGRYSGSCGGEEAPEAIFWWTAPFDGYFTFDTFGSVYDTLLYLWWATPECAPLEIPGACNDDANDVLQSSVTVWLYEGDGVIIVVDGWYSAGGYNLNISESNSSPNPPSRQETDCQDGWDNDGDGRPDCEDPDCYDQCRFP